MERLGSHYLLGLRAQTGANYAYFPLVLGLIAVELHGAYVSLKL